MNIIDHTAACFSSTRQYRVLWPQACTVTAGQLIEWARDDIDNGASDIFDDSRNVQTVEDAITVLNDSGTVTLARQS